MENKLQLWINAAYQTAAKNQNSNPFQVRDTIAQAGRDMELPARDKEKLRGIFLETFMALADLHDLQGKTIRATSRDAMAQLSEIANAWAARNQMNPAAEYLAEYAREQIKKGQETESKYSNDFDMAAPWVEKANAQQKQKMQTDATAKVKKSMAAMESEISKWNAKFQAISNKVAITTAPQPGPTLYNMATAGWYQNGQMRA
ncbi:MAG: hypothetical protein FWC61_02225 [Proteobacteria bacterium]|nr:hypothetical protein [Pseudomonadota bacterium]